MKYSELNLDSRLFSAIEKLNYNETTAIQEQAIPPILAGRDVAGLAQTGTGKTAAFLIPLIERILKTLDRNEGERCFKNWTARSFILILVPTRELADQINENVEKLASGCGLKSYPLYGGTGYEKQKEALQSGLQFVVSTPGRLIDLYKENHVDLKQVAAVVFDEADRMFDMGFKDDMKYILSRIPRERQFLVFSATLNFDVLNTAYQFGAEPIEINISRDQAKAENVKDCIIHLGNDEKPQHLLSILKKENPKQTMIFTNFKHNVDRLAMFLSNNGIPAMGISSLMNQTQRNNVIEKFKAENDKNVLVATDVAARGLDINGVDLVINFEMPQDAESYVHRIGRTGRAGNEGKAYSLISDKDIDSLSRVEDYTKKKIEAQFLEDSDLIKEFKPFSDEETSYKRKFDRQRPSKERGGRHERGAPRSKDRFERGERSDRRPRPPEAAKNNENTQGGLNLNERPKLNKEARHLRQPGSRRDQDRKNGQSPRPLAAVTDTNSKAGPQQSKAHHGKANQVARSFRSNANAAKSVKKKTITQKVKSFFQKIFG
jgi:ATP-dependent RNA helicase RhlE